MESKEEKHIPVMLNEVMEYLRPKSNDIMVDATVGLGGHTRAILERIGRGGRLIALDRDGQSLLLAKKNLEIYIKNCDFIHEDFRNVDKVLTRLGITQVDGFLFDFGISSFQMDNPERGFSLRMEGPLDMRMDQESNFSAFDFINSSSEKEIDAILKEYGQERWHARIARKIVEKRKRHRIETTSDLTQTVMEAIPYYPRREKIHPATRTFQAVRIAVNRELESISVMLDRCTPFLRPGGRIAVISFHSLEDKIVKEKFKSFSKDGLVNLLVKKPLRPTEQEARDNPRSRSARLRVAERS